MRPLMLTDCDTGKEPISQQVSKQAAWRGGGGVRGEESEACESQIEKKEKRGLQGGGEDVRQRQAGHRLIFWLTTTPQHVPIKNHNDTEQNRRSLMFSEDDGSSSFLVSFFTT